MHAWLKAGLAIAVAAAAVPALGQSNTGDGEKFLKAIEERRQPLTDCQSGLQVLKVLQAAQRSLIMNGEPVTLPLETVHSNGQLSYA